MVKNKEESKDCKEEKLKETVKETKKFKGFHEEKNVLSGKSQQHQAAALKNKFEKEQISEQVAITPVDKEQEEKTLILRFKDSNRFLDAVYEFEELKNITIPLDFDEGEEGEKGSFLVGISKEIGIEFKNFMKEKGLEIMPNVLEIDAKIAEVQNSRSKSALGKDNSITAQKVGKKENPEDLNSWLAHPNLSDLEKIDTATEEKKIS